MQLIVDAESVSVGLKMSVVQEPLPVTGTLLSDPILEPLESNSSDTENIPETSSEPTEKEQLSNEILDTIEQEINELLGDDEPIQSEAGKLDKEATVDDDKAEADETDNVEKVLTTIEEININTEPNKNQPARAEELKVNGDDGNYMKEVEKVSDEISTTDVPKTELEKVEETGEHLNGLDNTNDNTTNSVTDEEFTNKINDQEIADDFSETKSVEDNGDSLGEEINKLIANDLNDIDNIDDSDRKEKAAEYMEVDVDSQLEKIPDAEPAKNDGETIVNGISEEVEHMETGSDVSICTQIAEKENISVADNVKENSDEINCEEMPSNQDDKEIIMNKGPNASHVLHEESLEDFINATDIKEDPTLNDAELDNINENSSPNSATCDKSDSPAASNSIELVKEEPMDMDISIEATEDKTDTTPKDPSTEQVIQLKKNTTSTEDVSQNNNEENNSTSQSVLNKRNAESNVKVAKSTSTVLVNDMECFSGEEDETRGPAVIDVVNRKDTVIDEPTSPIQNKLDCPGHDKPTSPAQDKPSSPIQDSPAKAKLGTLVEDNHSSSVQAKLTTPLTSAEDKPTSPAENKPASPAEDKPASPAEDKLVRRAEEKPASPVEDKPASPAEDKPASPAGCKPSSPAEDKPASPAEDKPASPAEDKPVSPAEDKPASPVEDKPASPVADKPASPVEDKPASSAEDKPASPAQDRPASPAQDRPASPAQDRPASPAQDRPASPAQDNKRPRRGKDKTTENKSQENKDCVSLVDDDDNDDIMVIDEDSNYKCDKSTEGSISETVPDETMEPSRRASIEDKTISDNDDDDDVVLSTEVSEKEPSTPESIKEPEPIKVNNSTESESKEKKEDKPLVPVNFLNSFKTKMSEMTRADLEEFCLLKIVEGVVDRSNLSDIKAKLKTMMQNVEEWRKKAMVLNKQNRDLQIVLRTVQEEQKKKSDEVITPLKITRSVGMQVLMTENKTDTVNRTRGQKRLSNQSSNTQPPKPPPKVMSQPTKILKSPIPVPRLVPAQSSSPTKPVNTKSSPQVQNSTISSNSGGGKVTTPNGIRTYTQTRAAEKRSFSVSIDLTDDEPPPAKQMATTGKGIQNPVRLVPSQQLLAPARTSIMTHNNPKNSNPRQVYIPIGAPQGNIRPGQTIVFKNAPNLRARQPAPGTIVRTSQTSIRAPVPRNQNKHPAPLPQAYSQPQPPNWKALPPAPDLKISKIENGIVVSWKIDGYQEDTYEEIVSYQLYAYQETNAPASTFLWNKIGDIKALPLPMACTLTQFIAGYKYYFAVRAVDIRSRIGPFSLPGSILLLNK